MGTLLFLRTYGVFLLLIIYLYQQMHIYIKILIILCYILTKQILSYNDPPFHVILLIFDKFSKHKLKLPEDGSEAPKHVGAYVL
jgi:hypothetical protein